MNKKRKILSTKSRDLRPTADLLVQIRLVYLNFADNESIIVLKQKHSEEINTRLTSNQLSCRKGWIISGLRTVS